MPRDEEQAAIAEAYSNWAWNIAARVAFFAGVEWARKRAAAEPDKSTTG